MTLHPITAAYPHSSLLSESFLLFWLLLLSLLFLFLFFLILIYFFLSLSFFASLHLHLRLYPYLPPTFLLSSRLKEQIITVAVALAHGINVYAFDPLERKGVLSTQLVHSRQVHTQHTQHIIHTAHTYTALHTDATLPHHCLTSPYCPSVAPTDHPLTDSAYSIFLCAPFNVDLRNGHVHTARTLLGLCQLQLYERAERHVHTHRTRCVPVRSQSPPLMTSHSMLRLHLIFSSFPFPIIDFNLLAHLFIPLTSYTTFSISTFSSFTSSFSQPAL